MQLIGWYLAILRFLLSTNEYYLYTVIVLINIFKTKKISFQLVYILVNICFLLSFVVIFYLLFKYDYLSKYVRFHWNISK